MEWLDAKEYGVWLDGERIDANKIKTLSPNDLGWYQVSRLHKNAKNYGKFKYHVTLFTKEEHQKIIKEHQKN